MGKKAESRPPALKGANMHGVTREMERTFLVIPAENHGPEGA